MSSFKWEECRVVGIFKLAGQHGAHVNGPVIRTPEGNICTVVKLNAEQCIPHNVLRPLELDNVLLLEHDWEARPKHVVVSIRPTFVETCRSLGVECGSKVEFEGNASLSLAYVDQAAWNAWSQTAADTMLDRLWEHLRQSGWKPVLRTWTDEVLSLCGGDRLRRLAILRWNMARFEPNQNLARDQAFDLLLPLHHAAAPATASTETREEFEKAAALEGVDLPEWTNS